MQQGKAMAYAYRKLKVQDKNYSTYDLELEDMVFAIKILKHYLYGVQFNVYTNNKSLQYVFSQRKLNLQ